MPLQTGLVCTPEEISEASGTYGVGLIGLASPGSSAHAAAVVMAENSSPVEGMGLGMYAHRGHTQLRQRSETVV